MINQIRADFYRQCHTKGILATVLFTIAYAALTSWQKMLGGITIGGTAPVTALLAKHWSVLTSVRAATLNSSILVYVFIGLLVIGIGYEFSQRTYKNTLVTGINRLQFILAKYVTLLVDLFVSFALFYLTILLTALLKGRPLGASWGRLLSTTALTTLTMTFFVSVIFSLGVLLLVLSNSLVAAAIFVVICPLLVGLVAQFSHWHWLRYFDLLNAASAISLGAIKTSQLGSYLGACALVLAVSILLSALIIRRREL